MPLNRNLTDDQILIRDTIRSFAELNIRKQSKILDEKEEFSYDITSQMSKLGLLGAFLPSEYGGAELDYVSYIIAVEELARVDSSQAATIAAHNSLGTGPIYYFGNDEQKQKYLPQLSGGKLWGFGLTEPEAGSDAGNTQTTAVQDGDYWIINGSKIFITNSATDITIGSTILAVTGERPGGTEGRHRQGRFPPALPFVQFRRVCRQDARIDPRRRQMAHTA